LKGTGKHVMAGVNDIESFHQVLELASMVAGGRESSVKSRSFRSSPVSPSARSNSAISPDHAGDRPAAYTGGAFLRAHGRLHRADYHGRQLGQIHADSSSGSPSAS
jgi:hypothetical protein